MMAKDKRRITLVASRRNGSKRDWDESNPNHRLIFINALGFLRDAIERGVNEIGEDVARVIIDRIGTPLQFLEVLSNLPIEFAGDVLFVLEDGTGYLSSNGRGGDRVLYEITEHDVDFYLQTNGLVWQQWMFAPLDSMAIHKSM